MASTSGATRKKPVAIPQNIKAVIRIKPWLDQSVDDRTTALKVKNHKEIHLKDKKYTFDKVFKQKCTQIELYASIVAPMINDVVTGYNCTIFAYGQTGSGKTHTMSGQGGLPGFHWKLDDNTGIIPRASSHLFDELNKCKLVNVSVKVSFMELYNEEIRDLLAEDESVLNLFSDNKGVLLIPGLTEKPVQDAQSVCKLLQQGILRRQTAATLMNHQSSRSHTCFTITVATRESRVNGEDLLKVGKINLVDLAGSENIAKSGCKDLRAQELANINKSLLTLGRVIHALTDKNTKHIPYRDSKLTRILQDSLGGHTKTVIIATINPVNSCLDETANTLDYASRARDIRNNPMVNENYTKTELIAGLMKEIDTLQRDLDAARIGTGFYVDKSNYQQLIEALKLMTGNNTIDGETVLQMKNDRISELKQMVEFKLKEFENTIEECKRNKKELGETINALKENQAILQQEQFVSQHYEQVCNDKDATAKQLLNATNVLKSEKELLLTKLEKQYSINANNDTITQKAIENSLNKLQTHFESGVDEFESYKRKGKVLMEYIVEEKKNLVEMLLNIRRAFSNFDEEFLKNFSVAQRIQPVTKQLGDFIDDKIKVMDDLIAKFEEFPGLLTNVCASHADNVTNEVTSFVSDSTERTAHNNVVLEELAIQERECLERISMDEQMREQMQAILEKKMAKERACLEAIRSLRKKVKESQEKSNVKQAELMERAEGRKEQMGIAIENLKQKVNELRGGISKEVIADTLNLMKNFVVKLNALSTELDQTHEQFSKDLIERVSQPVLDNTIQVQTAHDTVTKSLLNSITQLMDDINHYQNIFTESITSTQSSLREEIGLNVRSQRVGDTPVNNSVQHPDRIPEAGPRDMLIAKFKQNVLEINQNARGGDSSSDEEI